MGRILKATGIAMSLITTVFGVFLFYEAVNQITTLYGEFIFGCMLMIIGSSSAFQLLTTKE